LQIASLKISYAASYCQSQQFAPHLTVCACAKVAPLRGARRGRLPIAYGRPSALVVSLRPCVQRRPSGQATKRTGGDIVELARSGCHSLPGTPPPPSKQARIKTKAGICAFAGARARAFFSHRSGGSLRRADASMTNSATIRTPFTGCSLGGHRAVCAVTAPVMFWSLALCVRMCRLNGHCRQLASLTSPASQPPLRKHTLAPKDSLTRG
jgi:hypothetical protein